VEACARKQFDINNLRAENARLREALEFYADDMNWQNVPATSHPDCMDFVSFIELELSPVKR
jgi:hypothetical protein